MGANGSKATKLSTLVSLFDFDVAKSKGGEDYDEGLIPFVTSAEANNGVVQYVEPDDDDKVFAGPAICISGLGHATIQLGKFLPKGNGGDSLTILLPKKEMRVAQLISFAAVFNVQHKWRFSFGRKCSVSRLKNLEVAYPFPDIKNIWPFEKGQIAKTNKFIDDNLETKVVSKEKPLEEKIGDEATDKKATKKAVPKPIVERNKEAAFATVIK